MVKKIIDKNARVYFLYNLKKYFQVTDMVQGKFQDILEIFSEILNFKIRQFKRLDGGWGTLDKETGQWNGMISNLVNSEADLITASLTACCNRNEVVDFLWVLGTQSLGLVIKRTYTSYL